jgi:hypothetical protein
MDDDLRDLLMTLTRGLATTSARLDPRPGRPRRDRLPPDALSRPERSTLGRHHRLPDDVSRCASEVVRVLGEIEAGA